MNYRHAIDEDSVTAMSLDGSEFSEEHHGFNLAIDPNPQQIYTSHYRAGAMRLTEENTHLSRDNLHLSLLGCLLDDREFDSTRMQKYLNENWPMAKVWVQLGDPLIPGFYIEKRNGRFAKIQCKYENVHKFCMRCGCLGHHLQHCHIQDNQTLEENLDAFFTEKEIQNGSPLYIDPNRPLFTGSMCAHGHKKRRCTRIMFNKYLQLQDFYEHVPEHYVQDGFQITKLDEAHPAACDVLSNFLQTAIRENAFIDTERRAAPAVELESRQDVEFQRLPDPQELCFSDSGSFYSSPSLFKNSDYCGSSVFAESDSEMPDSFYLVPEVPPPDDLSDRTSYVPSLFIANVPDYRPLMMVDSPNSVLNVVVSNSKSLSTDRDVSIVLLNTSSGPDSNSLADDNHCTVTSAFTAQLYYSSDDSSHGDTSCNRQARSPPTLRGRKKATKVTKRKNHGWLMSIQSLEEEYHSTSSSGVNQCCLKGRKAVSDSKIWRPVIQSHCERKRSSEQALEEAMDLPTKRKNSADRSEETGKGPVTLEMATPFENNLMCFAAVVPERLSLPQ
ncbi:OLC1v1030445C1 [Oldenlandia corymbosa var. corymbosa]|uniref:OLC1v1030445C1 n=1 Tax=Oldenlandia corymbosa var. corymbosa TaxID=529605 RepID=A0AAV1CJP1_OLDCO|nr:OLC1v1030445C1 [Oldenlandia corymbosa var. corymbosa]